MDYNMEIYKHNISKRDKANKEASINLKFQLMAPLKAKQEELLQLRLDLKNKRFE